MMLFSFSLVLPMVPITSGARFGFGFASLMGLVVAIALNELLALPLLLSMATRSRRRMFLALFSPWRINRSINV